MIISDTLSADKLYSDSLLSELELHINDASINDQALFYFVKSRWERNYGSLAKSLEHAEEANRLYDKLSVKDPYYHCRIKYYLSDMFGYNNNTDEAYDMAFEALDICKENNVPKEMANVYFSCHTSAFEVGKTTESLYFLEKAMEIDREIGDSLTVMVELNSLAALNYQLLNYNETIKRAKESLSYLPQDNFANNRKAIVHSTLGAAYLKLNKLDSAGYFIKAAEEQFILEKDTVEMARVWLKKVLYYSKIDSQANAFLYANKAYAIASEFGIEKMKTRARLFQAKFHLDFKKALGIIKELELLESVKNEPFVELFLETASIVYGKVGNYKKQSELLHKLMQYKDDKEKANSDRLITKLTNKFDLKENERALELSTLNFQLEKAQNKAYTNKLWILISALITVLLFTLLASLFFKQRRKLINLRYEENINRQSGYIKSLKDEISKLLEYKAQNVKLPPFEELNAVLDVPITEKEYLILKEVALNKTNKEIAEIQFISVNTVKYHLKNIYSKLDVSSKKDVLNKIGETIN